MTKVIKIYEQFNTFEDFHTVFEEYCKNNFINCRIEDSKLKNDGSGQYKFVQYNCVHSGDPDKIR